MDDPPADDVTAKAPRRRRGWPWWIVVAGLSCLVVVGLLLPARRCAREAARRSACTNNMREIVRALRAYAARHGSLPPAHTVDDAGRPLHSWRTLILPFLGERALLESIDLTKPWDDPANAAARGRIPQVYRCPSASTEPGPTTYVAVVAAAGCFRPAGAMTEADLVAAAHDTLMVIEVPESRSVHWMAPSDIDADEFLRMGAGAGTVSHHAGAITMAAFADGAVRPLLLSGRDGLALERRRAFLTMAADSPPITDP